MSFIDHMTFIQAKASNHDLFYTKTHWMSYVEISGIKPIKLLIGHNLFLSKILYEMVWIKIVVVFVYLFKLLIKQHWMGCRVLITAAFGLNIEFGSSKRHDACQYGIPESIGIQNLSKRVDLGAIQSLVPHIFTQERETNAKYLWNYSQSE